jgi:hypothetical protein
MKVDALLARAEIHSVLMRYCRAVDRGDVELLRSVYHDQALDHHGGFHGLGYDFAPYIVSKMDAVDLNGQHHITNVLIELDGDTAKVESYFFAVHPYLQDEERAVLGLIGGRYLDDFARIDQRWAIARREVILDWSRERLDGTDWPGAVAYPKAARRDDDPSFGQFNPRQPTVR